MALGGIVDPHCLAGLVDPRKLGLERLAGARARSRDGAGHLGCAVDGRSMRWPQPVVAGPVITFCPTRSWSSPVVRTSACVRRSLPLDGMVRPRMVVGQLVPGGAVLCHFPSMEPPVFHPPWLGMDRFQTVAAIPWGLHGTMVFRMDAEFRCGRRTGTGAGRDGRQTKHGSARPLDRVETADAVVDLDADALERSAALGGDFRGRNPRKGVGIGAPLCAGSLCMASRPVGPVFDCLGPGGI